jgi:hypothetical protein
MGIIDFVDKEAERLSGNRERSNPNSENGLYDDELRNLMVEKIQELLDRVAVLESARDRDDSYRREQAERSEVA